MTTVAVVIAGRSYRMACGEGEEGHLQLLARHVEQTLAKLRKGFGEIGDQRLTVMTAITIADELHDARARIAALEADLADLRATREEGDGLREALAGEVAGALDAASERIERIAGHLTQAGKE